MVLTGHLSSPTDSIAFKMETHVWIGQQVLNDVLPDGKVTIEPFGEFTVAPEIVAALRAQPKSYLTGTIGPDAFPDLASGQMTVHPGNVPPTVPGSWATDRWLRHLLEFFPTNARYRAFVYGYLSHAAADAFAHSYVNAYAGDIFNLEGETEAELRHVALEEYIKNHMPPIQDGQGNVLQPYNIVLDPYASPVDFPASELEFALFLHPDVADQYRRNPKTAHLALMYDFRLGLYNALQKVESLRKTLDDKIDEFTEEIDDLTCDGWMWGVDPGGCLLREATRDTVSVALEGARAVNDATATSVAVPLSLWLQDVDKAIQDYFVTGQRVAIQMMKGGNPQAEIERWLCESAPAFMAVPGALTRPGCRANSAVDDFKDGIHSLRQTISDNLGVLGWLVDPGQKVDEIVAAAITPELQDLGLQLAQKLTGESSLLTTLLTYRMTPITADGLNSIFAEDESATGLLEIPDIAQRVDADMHLTDGHFDPAAFNVVHNAVVLSKLALLTGSEVNRMVKSHVETTIYGTNLYPEGALPLLGVFRSIDGNHQWQEYGIPSPRQEGHPDPKTPEQRQYGYPVVRFGTIVPFVSGGFRLWQDCQTREAVFKQIFHGPVAPGIEVSDLLAPDDPNRASDSNPFPFAPESRSDCSATPPGIGDLPGRGVPGVYGEWTSPPSLTLPANVVAEATAASGAQVAYAAPTAIDNAGGSVGVNCNPGSGSVFPLGTTTVTCTATGASGSSATGTFTVRVVDTTAPVVTVHQSPPPNANGWNNTDVALTFSATDAVSQTFSCELVALQLTGGSPFSFTMTTEGAAQRVKVSCVDATGNRGAAIYVLSIDKTPPLVGASRLPEANAYGWNNSDVEAHLTAVDTLSGIDGNASFDVLLTQEGAGQSATRTFADRAGNAAEAMIGNINIDKTPPTIALMNIDPSATYTVGCAPTPGYTATDALSGIASSSGVLTGGNSNPVGGFRYAVTALDRAGNTAAQAVRFSVAYNFSGFFPPVNSDGSGVFRLGRTVPVKFRLADCHGSLLTNAVATLAVAKLTDLVLGTGEPVEVDAAGAANTDDLFRVSDLQYIFNLSTLSYSQGTYQLRAVVDDGTIHRVNVSLRAR